MKWLDITTHGTIIVNNLGNGNWSSTHIWNCRMSFSSLQLVIFFAVIKILSLDTTSTFEFTVSFISPTVFYIKFPYKFKLHAAILVPLGVKTKELEVRPLVWRETWVLSTTTSQSSDECGKLTQEVSVCNLYASEATVRFVRCLASTLKGPSKYHKSDFISKLSQDLI